MIALGYDPRGENGIPGRRYFVKRNGEIHTYHLHVFQTGHPEINSYLDFRDYLRVHPDKARAYSELKETLVRKFWNNSVAYTEGKNEFVREIDQLAAIYCKR